LRIDDRQRGCYLGTPLGEGAVTISKAVHRPLNRGKSRSGLPVMTWWRSPSAPTYASIDFVPISAGLKQASVIFLPPLIARILSAPSPSSSFETAQGNHPSAIRATRLREG